MNYEGETPVHKAVATENMEMVKIFSAYRHLVLTRRDKRGENVLFICARYGYEEIYQYFHDGGNPSNLEAFYKARGQ